MQKLNFIDMNETTSIFGSEEIQKICRYLQQKFSILLKNESFVFEAGYKGNQVQIKLVLSNKDQTFFYPIEAIFVHDDSSEEKVIPEDAALMMLDYLTLYFEEFLSQDRNVYLSLDWSVHQSDDFSFFLRGFVRNLQIEKIADEFLATHGHGEHSISPISSDC